MNTYRFVIELPGTEWPREYLLLAQDWPQAQEQFQRIQQEFVNLGMNVHVLSSEQCESSSVS